MSDDPAAFKAMFVSCRQVRDDVHFTFSVPAEVGAKYLETIGGFAKPGESRWFAIAQLKSTKEDQPQELHKERTRQTSLERQPARPHNPYSRRAGILCSDVDYHNFIDAPGIEDRASFAASYLRKLCDVPSRKDILPGTRAAMLFDKEYNDFIAWRDGPKHGAA